ncbi:hypothetical protein DL765_003199 [Monosporascus sp. GIB2]|nr:hypothetical protein DL765_003199 [Monosporascus sp. GIB2]
MPIPALSGDARALMALRYGVNRSGPGADLQPILEAQITGRKAVGNYRKSHDHAITRTATAVICRLEISLRLSKTRKTHDGIISVAAAGFAPAASPNWLGRACVRACVARFVSGFSYGRRRPALPFPITIEPPLTTTSAPQQQWGCRLRVGVSNPLACHHYPGGSGESNLVREKWQLMDEGHARWASTPRPASFCTSSSRPSTTPARSAAARARCPRGSPNRPLDYHAEALYANIVFSGGSSLAKGSIGQ